ncbi:MAG: hypothetical protein ACLFOY_14695 [Desulfatibacillaceae bacterium]
MSGTYRFTAVSDLAASREIVWDHVSTPDGVNSEFFPFLRMTWPPGLEKLSPETVPLGRRLCRSWILLFGLIPVDYDDIVLAEVEPGHGFLETSTMLTQRLWRHERIVEDLPGGGCRVRDNLEFEPRAAWAGRLQLPMFRAVFAYRHHRLRTMFG